MMTLEQRTARELQILRAETADGRVSRWLSIPVQVGAIALFAAFEVFVTIAALALGLLALAFFIAEAFLEGFRWAVRRG